MQAGSHVLFSKYLEIVNLLVKCSYKILCTVFSCLKEIFQKAHVKYYCILLFYGWSFVPHLAVFFDGMKTSTSVFETSTSVSETKSPRLNIHIIRMHIGYLVLNLEWMMKQKCTLHWIKVINVNVSVGFGDDFLSVHVRPSSDFSSNSYKYPSPRYIMWCQR